MTSASTVIEDADVADVLSRAVHVINPVVDVLARADPFGLKGRTRDLHSANGSLGKALDAAAWVLNTADVPGTQAWAEKDLDGRIHWWVRRVGALNTVLVASPGVLGAAADRLPVQDVLGFANQAIVLCAVARECGVVDYRLQVRLLGAVLCDRDLAASLDGADPTPNPVAGEAESRSFGKSLWHLVGLLRAIGDELVKRPRPRRFYHYLGMLPAVGAVAEYFGEYGALVRAAKEGRAWIERLPAVSRG
ncbi:hypothetical protein MMAD_40320 [Mycolicibacterium madagascariense]|uniref:Uncharacterized protein n=1 Tax=Mycolicibacterium madagascariense TaxID=212765 RepID=A0A7I7XKL6_9MYCO|nr:hypothetical protein [Mycolicibacterium madagascariense]MCV7012227.1 hypothetical protein [Mycolicibacterium madagascariense]BBZ29737.1 hypothetical protein MMAD_40320 [Mycolicibacterium madagascariense]